MRVTRRKIPHGIIQFAFGRLAGLESQKDVFKLDYCPNYCPR
jgi:hypothetical protein